LMPLTSLPPSKPRTQALGAERSERLSTTTAEGRTSSPQARRRTCSSPVLVGAHRKASTKRLT